MCVVWESYYQGCEGLVFVVDSADRGRFAEAKDALHRILHHERMQSTQHLKAPWARESWRGGTASLPAGKSEVRSLCLRL